MIEGRRDVERPSTRAARLQWCRSSIWTLRPGDRRIATLRYWETVVRTGYRSDQKASRRILEKGNEARGAANCRSEGRRYSPPEFARIRAAATRASRRDRYCEA